MAIKIGNLDISKIFADDKEVEKVYVGNSLVYQSQPPVQGITFDWSIGGSNCYNGINYRVASTDEWTSINEWPGTTGTVQIEGTHIEFFPWGKYTDRKPDGAYYTINGGSQIDCKNATASSPIVLDLTVGDILFVYSEYYD